VRLVDAPEGIETLLPNVKVTADADTVLLFVKSAASLFRQLDRFAKSRRLWVAWPKKASRLASDLSFPRIQDACGSLGLVAYKTCSVDQTWSAAAIAPRRRGV